MSSVLNCFSFSTESYSSLPAANTNTTIIDLEWIKYDCKKSGETRNRYTKIEYKTPEEFLDIVDQRLSTASNIQVVTDATGIKLNIYKDKAPTYFTSFDDDYLVFDAFNNTVESALQNSKTQCHGKRSVTFTLSDSFIPDIPVQMRSQEHSPLR